MRGAPDSRDGLGMAEGLRTGASIFTYNLCSRSYLCPVPEVPDGAREGTNAGPSTHHPQTEERSGPRFAQDDRLCFVMEFGDGALAPANGDMPAQSSLGGLAQDAFILAELDENGLSLRAERDWCGR